ncbi:MAG: S-adenosyl-l-methionine hydroxide adenosyltransferase [Chloroflexi bacterium]|nr:S-adenosyl-l-methionine hydroxide adenosyltransferase [Chloroflexota bacterium]
MSGPLLVFTTDFGLIDPYAGVMKGVALTINPDIRMVDLTHQVRPQSISQGSFLLGINHRYFPDDAIHVAVVDPGVGTTRRPILLSTPNGRFVAPDNGLLSGVVAPYAAWENDESSPKTPGTLPLPDGLSAVHLTNPDYWRLPVSHTFHGRDIFTPVAAHLSLGVPAEEMGEPIDDLTYLPAELPTQRGGVITGRVIYQDVYGNLVTNVAGARLLDPGATEVIIKGRSIHGLRRTFVDDGGEDTGHGRLVALVGSHGYLEVAVPNGSAAAFLEAADGEPVEVVVPAI